jgi:hypothetical protein
MLWWFDPVRQSRRNAADYRQNRWAALRISGSLTIAILMAAGPSAGQGNPPDQGAQSSPEAPTKGVNLEQVVHTDLFSILGKDVQSASGQAIGRVVDLLVDQTGQPRAAIIDFGGFLGVGTRKIAIDWNSLRFDAGDPKKAVIADLDRDEIKAAPEYKDSREVIAIVTAVKPKQRDGPDPDR